MKAYRKLFSNTIWSRGLSYYERGRVILKENTSTFCSAEVTGSEDYYIEITHQGSLVSDMYCSCPYAESGYNCKHMAAVLMEMEEKEMLVDQEPLSQIKREENEWKRLLNSYHTHRYNPTNAAKKNLDQSFSILLDSKCRSLLKESPDAILNVVKKAIDALDELHEAYDIPSTLSTLNTILLEQQKEGLQKQVQQFSIKTLDHIKRFDFFQILSSFAFPTSQEGIKQIENVISAKLKQQKMSTVSILLHKKIDIMRELHYDDHMILSSLSRFEQFEVVIDFKIKHYIAVGDYIKAKEILQRKLKIPSLSEVKRIEIQDQLGELYRIANDKEHYYDFVVQKLYSQRTNTANYVNLLRELYEPQEWQATLRTLYVQLSKTLSYSFLLKLFDCVHEPEAMLYLIYEGHDLAALLDHYPSLKEYDAEIANYMLYEFLCNLVTHADIEYEYRHIFEYLRILKRHPELQFLIQEVILYSRMHCARKRKLNEILLEIYDDEDHGEEWEEASYVY